MKILAPKNFFLLRGNHEIRDIQEQFSFYEECCSRFSNELWQRINIAFDYLPISAIIDGKVFCAHGGIPITVDTVEQLKYIPQAIDNPYTASPETWEIVSVY